MQLSDHPKYAEVRELLDLTYLSRRLLKESIAALEDALANPTADLVAEAARKTAELDLVTKELSHLRKKRDN